MIFAGLFITDRCNLRCKMCDYWKRKSDKNYLTPTQWRQVLNKLGVTRVHIIGMEPLLYKDFDVLLKSISKPGRTIMLTTNGLLLEKHLSAIHRYVHNTAVSLDGLPEVHDSIRGVPGTFNKAFNSLVKLKSMGSIVRVSFAVTPDNTHQIIPLYLKLWKHRIPMIINQFNFIHPDSCNGYNCKPSNLDKYDPRNINLDELYEAVIHCKHATFYPALNTMKELKKYYRDIPIKRHVRKSCPVLENTVNGKRYAIKANGDFTPPGRYWRFDKMGNALKMDMVPEDTKWMIEFNNDIKKNGLPPPCQRLCCAGKVL